MALKSLNHAIAIRPQSATAYLQRGLLHQHHQETDPAMDDFNHALQLDPHLAEAHIAMGSMYRSLGNPSRAMQEFSTALKEKPSLDAYFQLGQSYEDLGQHRLAIDYYTAAVQFFPDAPEIYRARATSELAIGEVEAAKLDRARAAAIEDRVFGLRRSQ
jgi:protein O-GlcNAc transferase